MILTLIEPGEKENLRVEWQAHLEVRSTSVFVTILGVAVIELSRAGLEPAAHSNLTQCEERACDGERLK
jgi:hypothetical protein